MYQILIVDSDERHMKKMKKILEVVPEKYVFYYASTPEMALAVLEQQQIDVFICELELPIMSGEEMFSLCDHISPDTVKIALSPALDIRRTLASINRCKTFRLILKPCQVADNIMPAVEEAIRMKKLTKDEEAGKEKKRRELERMEQVYEKAVEQIEHRKEEYGIVLDMVTSMVKNNLELGKNVPAARATLELQDYIRELQEAFIKYYILEPKNWEVNERLLLEEFQDVPNKRFLKMENFVNEDIPFSIRPNISYALYMMLKLISTHLLQYQIAVGVMEKDEDIVLSLRCNLDGSRDENGKICYRITGRENFEKIYRSTIHALQWSSHKLVVRKQINPYAIDLYFKV